MKYLSFIAFFCLNSFAVTSFDKKLLQNEFEKLAKESTEQKIKTCPVNFDESAFKNLQQWQRKIISFDGQVQRVEMTDNGAYYSQLKIGTHSIWVAALFPYKFKVGTTVRTMGYLGEIAATGDMGEHKFHQEPYHVLAIGQVDFAQKNLQFAPNAYDKVMTWVKGQIPSTEPTKK